MSTEGGNHARYTTYQDQPPPELAALVSPPGWRDHLRAFVAALALGVVAGLIVLPAWMPVATLIQHENMTHDSTAPFGDMLSGFVLLSLVCTILIYGSFCRAMNNSFYLRALAARGWMPAPQHD